MRPDLIAGLRAVVTDLDGTIVRPDETVSAATVATAAALREAGVPLIVATARTKAGISVLGPLQAYVSVAVCCNGAIGLVPPDSKDLWQHWLDQSVVVELADYLAATWPEAGLGSYDGRSWLLSPAYQRARGRRPRGPQHVVSVAELCQRPASTLAVCHPRLSATEVAAELTVSGVLAARATIDRGADDVVDIAPPGVTKGSGVRAALDHLAIDPAAVTAFGDGRNDLPVVAVVGQFVAMAEGDPGLLAAAAVVTGSVIDDGFADFILPIFVGHQGSTARLGDPKCCPGTSASTATAGGSPGRSVTVPHEDLVELAVLQRRRADCQQRRSEAAGERDGGSKREKSASHQWRPSGGKSDTTMMDSVLLSTHLDI
jgi:Cof subfamily protein (haloacid dehalogenase superfamily)